MPSPQRDSRLYAIKEHALAEIQLLKEEINIFLNNPMFIAGHNNPLSDVTDMLERISVQQGIIDVIEKEFK
jgi:hypothetical protein